MAWYVSIGKVGGPGDEHTPRVSSSVNEAANFLASIRSSSVTVRSLYRVSYQRMGCNVSLHSLFHDAVMLPLRVGVSRDLEMLSALAFVGSMVG